MAALLLRRILWAPLVLLGITILVFVLTRSLPGDPIAFWIGTSGVQRLPPELVQRMRSERALDASLPLQYLAWVRMAVLQGDLGRSLVDDYPVTTKIAETFPNTLLLNGAALLFSVVVGIPLGIWIGARSRRCRREWINTSLFALYAVPTFWLALVLAALFAVRWPLFPLQGMTSDGFDTMSGWQKLGDICRHLVLPVIALSATQLAVLARFTTNAFRDALQEPHIRAARGRGIPEWRILFRHAGRSAAVPLLSLSAVLLPALLSGSVIIERMFDWHGVGGLLFESVIARDYPMIMGITLCVAVGVLLVSVAVDIAYVLVDPRVRVSAEVQP